MICSVLGKWQFSFYLSTDSDFGFSSCVGSQLKVSNRVAKILKISISFLPRNLRTFENYPQLNLNWFMPFKPQNFSLILINGTLTLILKIENFWGSSSNKIFEKFSKNLKKNHLKQLKNSLKIRGFSRILEKPWIFKLVLSCFKWFFKGFSRIPRKFCLRMTLKNPQFSRWEWGYTGSSGRARFTRADSTHAHYKNVRIYIVNALKLPSNWVLFSIIHLDSTGAKSRLCGFF